MEVINSPMNVMILPENAKRMPQHATTMGGVLLLHRLAIRIGDFARSRKRWKSRRLDSKLRSARPAEDLTKACVATALQYKIAL